MAIPSRKNEPASDPKAPVPLSRVGTRATGTAGLPRRAVPHGETRGAQDPHPGARTSNVPERVAPILWILLGISAIFLVGVQIYVHRVHTAAEVTAADVPELPLMSAFGPLDAVQQTDLELHWDSVQGAVQYDLRILTDRGAPVVDPVRVWSTVWRPVDELLPGLNRGTYRWTVEALDSSGTVLARSLEMEFGIL